MTVRRSDGKVSEVFGQVNERICNGGYGEESNMRVCEKRSKGMWILKETVMNDTNCGHKVQEATQNQGYLIHCEKGCE